MNTTNSKNPGFELFTFFEKTHHLACISGKDGFFKKVNTAFVDKLGYTFDELYASPSASFIHAEDKQHLQTRSLSLFPDKDLDNLVNRYITKKGKVVWLEWTSIYSETEIVFAIAKDVTDKKLREKQEKEDYAKFRSLSSHFKNIIEKDRKHFAYQLHEELAQLAAVIKLNVNWITNNVSGLPEVVKNRVEHVAMVSELLIKKIQKISFSVSPNMLDYFGLKDRLEWLCHDFSILHGLKCLVENKYDEKKLMPEIKIDFFRICQESLNNIIAHAQAANVKISIADMDDKFQLTITDDGKGFDIYQQKQTDSLASIQVRVTSINGQLSVQSEPAGGTRICVTVLKDTVPCK